MGCLPAIDPGARYDWGGTVIVRIRRMRVINLSSLPPFPIGLVGMGVSITVIRIRGFLSRVR